MTACVNKNHGRRVAGVVTASLVGALTLGGVSLAAVPTVALAEQGSLQAYWYTNATVSRATDGNGRNVSDPNNATFASGTGRYLLPTELVNNFGDATDVTAAGYKFEYYKVTTPGSAGTLVDRYTTTGVAATDNAAWGRIASSFKSQIDPDGKYYVKVSKGGDSATFYFTLADTMLDGAKPAKSYTYNGDSQTIKFVNADGDKLDASNGVTVTGNAATDAGDYVATLEYKGKKVNVDYSVAKLDLSKAGLTYGDVFPGGSTSLPTSNDDFLQKLDAENHTKFSTGANAKPTGTPAGTGHLLEVVSVSNSDGTTAFGTKGTYTVKVKAVGADGTNNQNFKNIAEGTGTVTFTYADEDLFATASVYYGNKAAGTQLTFNSADGESYDASKLTVGYNNGAKVDPSKYTVKYYKADSTGAKGDEVKAEDLAKNGTYIITVKANAWQKDDGTWVAGTAADIKVTVDASLELNKDDNVAWYVDGEAANGNSSYVAYDGTDASKAVTAVVKDGSGKTLEAGKDYQLVLTDDKGKEVDSAVDAGLYKVTVKPLTFKWDGNYKVSFDLEVQAANLGNPKDLRSTETQQKGDKGQPGYVAYSVTGTVVAYTGSKVDVPSPAYQKVDRKNAYVFDKDGNAVYNEALSSDLYTVVSLTYSENDPNVTSGKRVTEAKDAGYYKVKVALTDKASNYQLVNDTYIFRVISLKPFADVQSPSWYAKGVAAAKSNRYVNGISGTQLFSPEAKITRADATVILFNMAGGSTKFGDDQFQYNELTGFNTGFSDVDGKAYYAKAVAWAKAAGVATGDAGTTNFRPTDQITRQEFAALLVKYAKSAGRYTAPTSDALSGLSDANSVDGWARDAVNWAVTNKVMGNGGYVAGTSDISRAEVATMGVNYQPKAL